MTDKPTQKAIARFFLRVGQAGTAWRDENTLPLFPLLMVMEPEMLEADAAYEAGRFTSLNQNCSEKP